MLKVPLLFWWSSVQGMVVKTTFPEHTSPLQEQCIPQHQCLQKLTHTDHYLHFFSHHPLHEGGCGLLLHSKSMSCHSGCEHSNRRRQPQRSPAREQVSDVFVKTANKPSTVVDLTEEPTAMGIHSFCGRNE